MADLNKKQEVAVDTLAKASGLTPESTLADFGIGAPVKLTPINPIANSSQKLTELERLQITMKVGDTDWLVIPIELEDGYVFTNSKGKDITANGVMGYLNRDTGQYHLARGIYSGKGTEVNTVFGKYEWCDEQYKKMKTYVKTPITWRETDEVIESKESSE